MPPLVAKYTDWRTIRWPLVTRPQDSIPSTIVTGPYSYNSLAHIHPLLLFPFIGTDLTRSGDQGTQWGAVSVFSDEMQKHLLTAFAFYGDVSKTLTYGIEYENNQLLPNIVVGASDILGFNDVLDDIPYYERTRTYNLGFNFGIHTPNSTEKLHDVFFGASYEDLDPWNISAFDGVLPWHRPLAAKLLDIHFGYGFLSPLFQFGASATHTDKKLASDLTRTKLRVTLHKEIPFGEDKDDEAAFIIRGAADFGDELPQDFLGFYKHDAFESGFDLTTIHARERLRGIRRYYYGNRLLSGSFELRQRDKFFGSLVPLIQAFEPQLVEFFDIGSAWYANAPDNNPQALVTPLAGTQWLKTIGLELRSELGFDMSLSGGVGWEMIHAGFKSADYGPPDWYIRVSAGL